MIRICLIFRPQTRADGIVGLRKFNSKPRQLERKLKPKLDRFCLKHGEEIWGHRSLSRRRRPLLCARVLLFFALVIVKR